MEEAEELCDRLGIFVDGTLRCVGNPKELTGRFGGFLILTLTTSPLRTAESEAFVRRLSPNSVLTYRLGGTLKFDLPLAEVSVASVFAAVTAAKEELGILDWGVANMTLEEGARERGLARVARLPLTPSPSLHQISAINRCDDEGVS
jgi:ABC-type multidrug transport system ATPase subunit